MFHHMGGVKNKKFTVFKVVFKIHFRFQAILSHFNKKIWVINGRVPILSDFSAFFGFRKFIQVFDKKCPNYNLVSEKNTLFFFTVGGEEGSDQGVKNFTDFIF